MTIQSIKQRRDGKFAVAIAFGRDLKTLHKVYTQAQLDDLKSKVEYRNPDFEPLDGSALAIEIARKAQYDREQAALWDREHESFHFERPIST